MLDKLCRDPLHLEYLLKRRLEDEKDLKIFDWLKLDNFHDVEEWKENVHLMMKINYDCGFQSETFALAVHILDNFLGFVKVHGKYLKCASFASFYIASKLLEEEEFVPSLSNFVMITGNKFTCNDIARMEKIILDKSGWEMQHVTAIDFLEIFFSLVCAQHFKTLFGSDSLAYSIYRNLANQAQQCICSVSLLHFKSSLKALALLSCTLEKITSRWFLYIEQIARLAKIDIQELLDCRDAIKTVVFGQIRKPRAPRLKKFSKRYSVLAQRRSILSPIVESPSEMEGTKLYKITCDTSRVSEGILMVENDLDSFNEEVKRLRRISLEEFQLPSPAKRRKLSSCGMESKLDQDVCGMISSPVKDLCPVHVL